MIGCLPRSRPNGGASSCGLKLALPPLLLPQKHKLFIERTAGDFTRSVNKRDRERGASGSAIP
jgi:hypothetical protein